MRGQFGRRGLLAGGIAVIAVAAGGGAYAAASGGTITVCVGHKDGSLYQARRCHKKDHTLTWNTQGPQGPQGRPGAQGAPGAPGAAGKNGTDGAPGGIGPSNAYASYKDGPVSLPSTLGTIASLSIPQGGDYVVFAKVALHDDQNKDISVTCKLSAGADFDYSFTDLTGNTAGYVAYQTPALSVTHVFGSAGTVTLACNGAGVTTDATYIKMTAIRVGSLTNSASS